MKEKPLIAAPDLVTLAFDNCGQNLLEEDAVTKHKLVMKSYLVLFYHFDRHGYVVCMDTAFPLHTNIKFPD